MKDVYVQAVHKCLAAGTEPAELFRGLRDVMNARGHIRLLPSVLRTVVRERTASRAQRTVVRVANQAAYEAQQQDITTALAALAAHETPTVVTDDSLIGGYQVEANYQRVDSSYKQLLTSLYRNITA